MSTTQDAPTTAEGQITTDTPIEHVFVDGLTGYYHDREAHAGPAVTRYSRPQAERFGFDRCPTCRRSGGGAQ